MSQSPIDLQFRRATYERIANHTVCIAVENNTGIGTGTLIAAGSDRFILTAHHVIKDIDISDVHFWFRPLPAMNEMAARDTSDEAIGPVSRGIRVPIKNVCSDAKKDISTIEIDDSFVLPEGAEFYKLEKSAPFSAGPEEALDGMSILMFGFPIGNARELVTIGNNKIHFLGAASHVTYYSSELNANGFTGIASTWPPHDNFLFSYQGLNQDIEPHGFSGCGVWVETEDPSRLIWSSDPILIGMAHTYYRKRQILAAIKLPAIVQI